MNLVSGNLFWTKTNKILNKYGYLSEDINCEVAIIGAGITGAICAYYFTMAGINTILVDKNIIGYGSTSACTSILQYEIDTDLMNLRDIIGIDNAVKCFKLCEKSVYDIENIINNLENRCGFNLKDCFYYTNKIFDSRMLKEEFKLRKEHGFDVEFMEKKNSREKFSFPFKGGIYSRRCAGEIDPYKFTQELIRFLTKKGLRVFENTEVTRICNKGTYVALNTKNNFKIRAKKALISTGYEAKQYIEKNILDFTRSFTIVTKPVESFEGWHNKCIIRDTEDPYTYLRTTIDNRIIIGGENIPIGIIRSNMMNSTFNRGTTNKKYYKLTNKLKKLFPNIKDIEVEYKFSGLFGNTKDNLPYIGEYENMPNCYFCLGYGSNGILYAVLGAQLLVELYNEKKRSGLNLFKFDR